MLLTDLRIYHKLVSCKHTWFFLPLSQLCHFPLTYFHFLAIFFSWETEYKRRIGDCDNTSLTMSMDPMKLRQNCSKGLYIYFYVILSILVLKYMSHCCNIAMSCFSCKWYCQKSYGSIQPCKKNVISLLKTVDLLYSTETFHCHQH